MSELKIISGIKNKKYISCDKFSIGKIKALVVED